METSKPAWILLQNGLGLIVGFLTMVLILRDAGFHTWGLFSAALSFGLVFSFVSDLGINTAHVRMIAAGKDRNEYNNALIFMKVLLTLVYVGVIFLAVFIWTRVFHQAFESPLVYLSLLLLIPYFVGLPYIQANRAFFTGTQEAFKMSFPPIMESITRFIAVFVLIHMNVFHFPSSSSGLYQMALLISISYSISYAVYAILSFVVGMPWNFRMPKLETIKTYLRYSYPLIGVAFTTAVAANLAQILVFFAYGADQSAGFATDYRYILMITGFTMSVTILILPILTSLHVANGDYGKTMGQTVKYLTVLVTPLTAFIAVLAAPVLNLLSSAAIPYSFAFQIMLVGSWFWTMSIPFWTHFNAVEKTKISGTLNTLAYTLFIVLDIVLIPRSLADFRFAGLGVNGAAYSYLFSGIVLFIGSAVALMREVKIPITYKALKGSVMAILLGLLYYLFLHSLLRLPLLVLIGLLLLYVVAYIGLLLASKTISREELVEILNMVNFKKLFKYAVEELKNKSQ
ncbi:MAG: oligosaccharide flippase family protein [Candidatus Thermoplasmatota archaeon]|nr:oligosaccharide flippase family protein [Candidatus Thermoplasmatota archaeon]MCL6003479.1 oligosaccharide flippase family protein [Candidatus Thermoplasmatota archaeon]